MLEQQQANNLGNLLQATTLLSVQLSPTYLSKRAFPHQTAELFNIRLELINIMYI